MSEGLQNTQAIPDELESTHTDEEIEEEGEEGEPQAEVWGELYRTATSGAATSGSDDSEDDGFKFALHGGLTTPVIIGRAPTAHIRVNDPHVSSQHCEIWRDDERQVWVKDTSLSGTYVNGEKVEKNTRKRLVAGDSLCLLRPSFLIPHVDKKKKSPSKMAYQCHEFIFRASSFREGPCHGEINKKYEVMDELGSGSFATVRRGVDKKTGKEVAVKIIEKKKFQFEPEKWKDQLKEIEMLKRLDHDSCVRLLDTYTTDDAIYIVMEFVRGGELFDRIKNKGKIPEQATRTLIKRLLLAVDYLHSQGIVHRDLKPENILLMHREEHCYHIKIADFGVARLVDGGCKTLTGSMSYIAPEVLERKDTIHGKGTYDFSCDLWSIGCIVYVCLMAELPFRTQDDDNEVGNLKDNVDELLKFRGKRWKDISDGAKDFLSGLFHVDATKRFTTKQALQHEWISNADNHVKDENCGETIMSLSQELDSKKRMKALAPPVPLFSQ